MGLVRDVRNSNGHARPASRRKATVLFANLLHAHLRQAGRGSRRHLHDCRPERHPARLDQGQWKESDDDLCDARPRRSLVRDRSATRTVSRHASGRFAGCRESDEGAVERGNEVVVARAVIAGHKRPGNEDSPRILEETRQYIRDFDGIAETARTARELYDQMLKLHPLRMNVNALWTSARAIKG